MHFVRDHMEALSHNMRALPNEAKKTNQREERV